MTLNRKLRKLIMIFINNNLFDNSTDWASSGVKILASSLLLARRLSSTSSGEARADSVHTSGSFNLWCMTLSWYLLDRRNKKVYLLDRRTKKVPCTIS